MKKKLLQTRVSPALGKQVESAAAAAGMSVATWLRVLLLERFDGFSVLADQLRRGVDPNDGDDLRQVIQEMRDALLSPKKQRR